MKKLDDSIKKFYADQQLSAESLEKLLASSQNTPAHVEQEDNGGARSSWSEWQAWKVASIALVFAVTLSTLFFTSNKDVTQSVLTEIAMNHNKHLDVEFPFADYDNLKTSMTRLDFNLLKPDFLAVDYQLLGGRYCSIQGRIAAQLKVINTNNNKLATLYVTTMTDQLSRIQSQSANRDSVDIKLWNTNGLFYGLATN